MNNGTIKAITVYGIIKLYSIQPCIFFLVNDKSTAIDHTVGLFPFYVRGDLAAFSVDHEINPSGAISH